MESKGGRELTAIVVLEDRIPATTKSVSGVD